MRRALILYTTRLDLLKRARERTAQRFANIDTYAQEGAVPEFDRYVHEKQTEDEFENFDQRVEHAFQKAWATNKAEIWNAHKRSVREGTLKKGLTPLVLTDISSKLDDRKSWLREVWAQVDSDYRSGDEARVASAMQAIQQAHANEGNEYMEWAYQKKYDMRFMGPKERAETEAELKSANFPDISEEEVNRYMNRRTSMNELEETITEKFGQAGRAHWEILQTAKDDEYREKIDMAVSIYEALQEKEDEAEVVKLRRTEKAFHERKARSKLYLEKALEREEARKKQIEIDTALEAKRKTIEFERRKKVMKNVLSLHPDGSPAAMNEVRRRTLADVHARNNAELQAERSAVMEKKKALFATMRRMQRDASERSALSEMTPEGRAIAEKYAADTLQKSANLHDSIASTGPLGRHGLWNMVHNTIYKTPAATIHQARIDAHKTHSTVYKTTRPQNLRNVRKNDISHGSGGFETRFHYGHTRESGLGYWGLSPQDVHDLDPDGSKTYVRNEMGYYVENTATQDAEKKYNEKHGKGATFRKKQLYEYPKSDT